MDEKTREALEGFDPEMVRVNVRKTVRPDPGNTKFKEGDEE